MLTNCNYNN